MLTPNLLCNSGEEGRLQHDQQYAGHVRADVEGYTHNDIEQVEPQIVDEDIGNHDFPQYVTEQQLEKHFETCATNGLAAITARRYLAEDGPNELEKVPPPGFCILFLIQLTSFVILLLIAAAIASVTVNATDPIRQKDVLSYTTGKMIFLLVLVNAAIAAYVENQAGNGLDALAKLGAAKVRVIRDGAKIEVPSMDLVKGDVVLLSTGDVVPADCRIVQDDDFKVSEMPLTGEPDDRTKTSKIPPVGSTDKEFVQDNMVYSGCSVTNGKARVIVYYTGMNTKIGRIAGRLNEAGGEEVVGEDGEKRKQKKVCFCLPNTSANLTPLQKNVERLGARIAVFAMATCLLVYLVGGILGTRDTENPDTSPWLYMIVVAVTLAVAAIPEGIPLCVTISLSLGCAKMMKKHVLIKKIAAVETLGSASVICSDKTGTLTEAKMTMQELWSGGVSFVVSGKGFDPTVGNFSRKDTGADATTDPLVVGTLKTALLCSDTTLEYEEEQAKWKVNGNSTEAPIVVAGRKVQLHESDVGSQHRTLFQVPFSSGRKMMLMVRDMAGACEICPGGYAVEDPQLAVVKGAPQFLIPACSKYLTSAGTFAPMTEEVRAEMQAVDKAWASRALRVLVCAVNPLPAPPCDYASDQLTVDEKFQRCRSELSFVGMWAAQDPDRDGVPEAVTTAREAGVRVVMITGDGLDTAIAIAKNVNILRPEDGSVQDCARDCLALRPTGLRPEDYLPEPVIDEMTARVRVFARAQPEDKLVIVNSFQRQGLCVAMTGDGVNDAPALKQAEIGVAMGEQGTEVAKGAADMVLQDDNFCSIVKAVEMGRAIYSGIQKFVAFIMSVHIAEVIQIFFCIVTGIPIMRKPLQILFLILVTDLPPSIALGVEPGETENMTKPPRPRDEPVVLSWMWVSIIMNGFILSAVIIVVYIFALMHYCEGHVFQSDIREIEDHSMKLAYARTVAFVSLVFSENVRAYTSRSFRNWFFRDLLGNRCMQYAVVAAQACLMVAVFVPFLSDTILELHGAAIWWWGWAVALAGPLATLLLCELAKFVTSCQMDRYYGALADDDEGCDEADDSK